MIKIDIKLFYRLYYSSTIYQIHFEMNDFMDDISIKDMRAQTLECTIDSNKSAKRSLVMITKSQEICSSTLQELSKQGNQIENCRIYNEQLESNLKQSETK